MRILLVNKYAHATGGADVHCLALAALLRRRGHEVSVLSTSSAANREANGAFVPLTVTHTSRVSLRLSARLRVAARACWNPSAADATRELIRIFRPHVIHTHKLYPQLSVAPVVVARRLGVPLVHTLHDHELCAANPTDPTRRLVDRNETRLDFRALNTALYPIRRAVHAPAVDRFIAVSRYLADVHRQAGIRARVVYNFLAPTGHSQSRRELESRSGVVFAGLLHPNKGARDVVALAKALPEVKVLIAGDGPLAAELVRSARGTANLTVVGWTPRARLLEWFASARLVVLPARAPEAGPLLPIEAFSAGTPVVSYEAGGLGEYVRKASAGEVVRADVPSLVKAVQRLLTDERRWREYSRNASGASQTVFSPEARVRDIEATYRRAIEARMAATPFPDLSTDDVRGAA